MTFLLCEIVTVDTVCSFVDEIVCLGFDCRRRTRIKAKIKTKNIITSKRSRHNAEGDDLCATPMLSSHEHERLSEEERELKGRIAEYRWQRRVEERKERKRQDDIECGRRIAEYRRQRAEKCEEQRSWFY
jgi:hypothetical protein